MDERRQKSLCLGVGEIDTQVWEDNAVRYLTGHKSNDRQVIWALMWATGMTRLKETMSCGWDMKLSEE